MNLYEEYSRVKIYQHASNKIYVFLRIFTKNTLMYTITYVLVYAHRKPYTYTHIRIHI